MASLTTSAFPLLPLDAGVVLPGMTVTLALETPEARAAAEAAEGAGDRLVLVPRLGRHEGPGSTAGRFANHGTVARVERRGNLPGGTPALVVRGEARAAVGAATSAAGPALWVSVDLVEEPPSTDRARELAAELRAVLDAIAEHRGAGLWRDRKSVV